MVTFASLGDLGKDLWYRIRNHHRFVLVAGLLATSSVLTIRLLGGLQLLELRLYDRMVALQPSETKDPRVIIVGITDDDLDNHLGTSTISDQTMAELITKIKAQQPRIIGLDYYRNLPHPPGADQLNQVFAQTPDLIGIEKVIGNEQSQSISGNDLLTIADQVAASDIVVDRDGRVRRGLLFPATRGERVVEGLGLRLALDYLAGESITPDFDSPVLTFNEVQVLPLERQTGGYVNVDAQGYQILLNLRKQTQGFEVISLQQVLLNEIPADLMRDRIVLIGSMALSSADIFYTAKRHEAGQLPIQFGVEIHGEIASQIISAVLDGRPLIYGWPEWLESLIILGLSLLGSGLAKRNHKLWQRLVLIPGTSMGLVALSWGALVVNGLWLPVLPALLGMWVAAGLTGIHRTTQLQVLSANDKLTGLANRRTFDETLQQAWFKALRSQQPIALIIGDVDHFKKYNDTYGHPQGDECLKRVGQAIRTAVPKRNVLSARYGGEEFVVLLPNTSAAQGVAIANAILTKLASYELPHMASETAQHVTMSFGVTSFVPKLEIPPSALVEIADLGLYTAKKSGRNRAVLHQPETLDRLSNHSSNPTQAQKT